MKAITLTAIGALTALAGTAALAAIVSGGADAGDEPREEVAQSAVSAPASPRETTTAPAPAAAPTPLIQEPVYDNYLDAPQTPGDWAYMLETGEQAAAFVVPPGELAFFMMCEEGEVQLARAASSESLSPRAMSVTTESVTRQLTTAPMPNRPLIVATLDARDPLLDAMAITKGRFAVELEGETTLYLPAWTEVSRVIEDCR
ncbi:MAG: hypothetical protein AAF697_09020 [Pseudomonadota bacterium]